MINQKANFRYDINALRAIAVIGVVLFHYKIPGFAGGFSGVDIFYVISGYLMSRIVINGLQKKEFSIGNFYRNRVKRIIPALMVLIVSILIVAFFIYLPIDYRVIAKNSAASLFFVSNMLYGTNSNYFNASSDTNVLLHTWSLSVEWQFYLILPLALSFLNRFIKNNKSIYRLLFIITTVVVFMITVFISEKKPTASFYFLPTRSWEMLMGGIAFLIEDKIKFTGKRYLVYTGYIALFLSLIFLNSYMVWPGYFTLIPVLGTFLIIAADDSTNVLLKNRVVQFFGKISYSLYLWHWPVLVVSNYMGFKHTPANMTLLISLSIIFAYSSYRYVESMTINKSRNIWMPALALCVIACLFYVTDINNIVFDKKAVEISDYAKRHIDETAKQFSGSCFISRSGVGLKNFDKSECLGIKAGMKNFILIGDSHAAQYSQSMRQSFAKMNINLNLASVSGCLPILKQNGLSSCKEVIDFVYQDYLPKNASKMDGVIICANWINSKDNKVTLLRGIQETISYLNKINLKTIIIGQNETYNIPFTSIAAREQEYNEKLSDNYLVDESYQLNLFLRDNLKLYYVDVYDLNTFLKVSSECTPYMLDQNHFTKYGADLVTQEILADEKFIKFLN